MSEDVENHTVANVNLGRLKSDPYTERFQDPSAVSHYQNTVYQPGSKDSFIWDLQRPQLIQLLRGANRHDSYLDFACGTGRVLRPVSELFCYSVGLDVSKAMLDVARRNAPDASFLEVDIIENPALLGGSYDAITSFRYFLNASEQSRAKVMGLIAGALRDEGSVFVFNVHGNKWSLRHLALAIRTHRENEMSPRNVQTLTKQCGLRVVRWYGYGVCPDVMHRNIGPFARLIDRMAARVPLLRYISYDLMFECRLDRERDALAVDPT